MHPSRTRSSRGTNSLRAGKIPPPMTPMPRDQRSPRPPLTRKNPVGHSSGTLPLWLPLSLWERGLGGEVRGERNVSSPRTLPSPRRRASRRSDSAARRRGFSRQPPPAPKQPTDRSHHTITRHHPTTPQFFHFPPCSVAQPSGSRSRHGIPLPSCNHQQPSAPSQPNKRASATCSPDQAQVTPRLTPPRPRPILTVHALV